MFLVKDLLVRVVPAPPEQGGQYGPQYRPHSADAKMLGICGFCTDMDTCGGCTFCTPTWSYWPCPGGAPEDLGTLKAQLQGQLAAVEKAEQQQREQQQTSASASGDLASVERKLNEALEELNRLKSQQSAS